MQPEWPLILFTFFLCLSGGILAAQGFLTFQGKGKKMQMLSLVASLVALVIGGLAVFTHLQHWERIFNAFTALLAGNGFGVSGITLELWGCVLCGITIVLYFLFMRRSEDGIAPKWCAVLAIVVGIALPAVTGDSYLMPALPAWNTPLLIVYYILNTVFMGSLTSLVIARVTGADDAYEALSKVALVGGVLQLVAIVVYAIFISCLGGTYSADIDYYFDPTLPDVAMVNRAGVASSILIGSNAPLFWIGAVIVGVGLPLLLLDLSKNSEHAAKFAFMKKIPGVGKLCSSEKGAKDGEAAGGEPAKTGEPAKAEESAKDDATAKKGGKIASFFGLIKLEGPAKVLRNYEAWALVCVVLGGFAWRVVLYLVALHAFALY